MKTGAAEALRQRPRRGSPSSSASLSPSGPVLTASRGRRRAAAPRGALALLPPAAAAAMLPPHVGPPAASRVQATPPTTPIGCAQQDPASYWPCGTASRSRKRALPRPSPAAAQSLGCDVTCPPRPSARGPAPRFWVRPPAAAPPPPVPELGQRLPGTRSPVVRAPGPSALPVLHPPMALQAQACS